MRLTDWPARLDVYLRRVNRRKFSYHSERGLDCCTFTFGAIKAMTGEDLYPFHDFYFNRAGAIELMRGFCGFPGLDVAAPKLFSQLAFTEQPPLLAHRGDVVLIAKRTGGHSLGVIDLGGRMAIAMVERGLWRFPLAQAIRSWSV